MESKNKGSLLTQGAAFVCLTTEYKRWGYINALAAIDMSSFDVQDVAFLGGQRPTTSKPQNLPTTSIRYVYRVSFILSEYFRFVCC